MASFYVTNFPDNVDYVDIRKAFEVCGILLDVYVLEIRMIVAKTMVLCVLSKLKMW